VADTPLALRGALPDLLEQCVDQRLVADVPVGVFLSGGIDSSAILALAARRHPDSLQAFTLSFDEDGFDESARARAIASHLGIRHHVTRLSAKEALAHIETAFDAQDLPSHDGLNTWFVSRAARGQGLVVALAGTGGDELFAGYLHFRRFPTWLRLGRAARFLPRRAREVLYDGLVPSLPTRFRKGLGVLSSGGDPRLVYRMIREMFSPVQCRELYHQLPSSIGPCGAREHLQETVEGGDESSGLSRLELDGYLRDTQLRDVDTMSMAHSLEVRAPLLDHRLAELMLRIPSRAKFPEAGLNKPLLVRASGLPARLLRGPKRGFVLPWEPWLRGPLAGLAEAALSRSTPDQGALDSSALARTWRRFLRGRVGYSRIITLLVLQRWCRRLAIGPPSGG
jgi:asparagine synthase (glutamine-hydrolysing)